MPGASFAVNLDKGHPVHLKMPNGSIIKVTLINEGRIDMDFVKPSKTVKAKSGSFGLDGITDFLTITMTEPVKKVW